MVSFKNKWQAKLYSKLLWLIIYLTQHDLDKIKFSFQVKYPDETWTVIPIKIQKVNGEKEIK
tara:strand:+ start:769 stop:954 length:186 start_codon:yes stop_codon:yes gene_type:complete